MEAMAIPIKPDKVRTWESWMDQLSSSRKTEFADFNERYALTTHNAWLQSNPDGSSLAIVVVDGPGATSFMGKMMASDDGFDSWFRSNAVDVHPMDPSSPPPAPERRL
jgi:hypothetical protein